MRLEDLPNLQPEPKQRIFSIRLAPATTVLMQMQSVYLKLPMHYVLPARNHSIRCLK